MYKRKRKSQLEWELHLISQLAPVGECLEWQGYVEPKGYGTITRDRKSLRVHRCVYKIVKGKISKLKVLDHLCRNKICANPDHLEEVKSGVNVLRGQGLAAKNLLKTHCKWGHEFTKENSYSEPNKKQRRCRKCKAIRSAERRKRLKNV